MCILWAGQKWLRKVNMWERPTRKPHRPSKMEVIYEVLNVIFKKQLSSKW